MYNRIPESLRYSCARAAHRMFLLRFRCTHHCSQFIRTVVNIWIWIFPDVELGVTVV